MKNGTIRTPINTGVSELRKVDIDKFLFLLFNTLDMGTGADFVAQLEVVMGKFVGQIVCQSIMRNQLSKFNKDKAALTADDCKILIQSVLKAVSLFVTKEEAGRLQSELDKLFKTYFS